MGSVVNKKATSSSIYGKYLIFQDSITPTVYKLFHKIEKRTLFSKEHYEVRVTSILKLDSHSERKGNYRTNFT